jgi:hypothetical protein
VTNIFLVLDLPDFLAFLAWFLVTIPFASLYDRAIVYSVDEDKKLCTLSNIFVYLHNLFFTRHVPDNVNAFIKILAKSFALSTVNV